MCTGIPYTASTYKWHVLPRMLRPHVRRNSREFLIRTSFLEHLLVWGRCNSPQIGDTVGCIEHLGFKTAMHIEYFSKADLKYLYIALRTSLPFPKFHPPLMDYPKYLCTPNTPFWTWSEADDVHLHNVASRTVKGAFPCDEGSHRVMKSWPS